jgi:hypothetical protein
MIKPIPTCQAVPIPTTFGRIRSSHHLAQQTRPWLPLSRRLSSPPRGLEQAIVGSRLEGKWKVSVKKEEEMHRSSESSETDNCKLISISLKRKRGGSPSTYRCSLPASSLRAPKLDEMVLNSTCFSSTELDGSIVEVWRR